MPAYAGIPVTHRDLAQSFAVLTGNTRGGSAHYGRLSGVDTLVLLMGVRNLEGIATELIDAGRAPETPAATIQWGTTPQQRSVTGTLATIADRVREAGLEAPAVTVVGEVVRLHDPLRWFQAAQGARGPLAGQTVAVTRTRVGASDLSERLRARGASVLEVPLIRFAPTSQPEALHARLRDLSGVAWLLLTSNQAVAALFEHLDALGLDARHLAGTRLAAVGPSTARSLAERGLRADFVPSVAGARHQGAQIPATPDGGTLLHLTSQLAEDHLERALAARGLPYGRAELYRTEPARPDDLSMDRLRGAAVVTLASGRAARHLAALAGTDFRVAAMGEQTADAAREAGFTRVTVAAVPTLDALADAAEAALRAGDGQ